MEAGVATANHGIGIVAVLRVAGVSAKAEAVALCAAAAVVFGVAVIVSAVESGHEVLAPAVVAAHEEPACVVVVVLQAAEVRCAGEHAGAEGPSVPVCRCRAFHNRAGILGLRRALAVLVIDQRLADAADGLEARRAEAHGVDSEVIWEDFESVDDLELLETAAGKRKEGKNKNGGLNAKGVASYRRENPGSKLQTAVTTKPSKLKKGSKAAKRRKSFCARMSGVKGPMKKPNGKPTRKALALRKWNC